MYYNTALISLVPDHKPWSENETGTTYRDVIISAWGARGYFIRVRVVCRSSLYHFSAMAGHVPKRHLKLPEVDKLLLGGCVLWKWDDVRVDHVIVTIA